MELNFRLLDSDASVVDNGMQFFFFCSRCCCHYFFEYSQRAGFVGVSLASRLPRSVSLRSVRMLSTSTGWTGRSLLWSPPPAFRFGCSTFYAPCAMVRRAWTRPVLECTRPILLARGKSAQPQRTTHELVG